MALQGVEITTLISEGQNLLNKITGIEMLSHVNVKCCARDFMETSS